MPVKPQDGAVNRKDLRIEKLVLHSEYDNDKDRFARSTKTGLHGAAEEQNVKEFFLSMTHVDYWQQRFSRCDCYWQSDSV